MKTTKNILFNKNQVIVNKDTFDTMNKVINEHKIEQLFNEVNNYASSYKSLEKENQNIKR